MDKGNLPERRFVLEIFFFSQWEIQKWDVVVKEV